MRFLRTNTAVIVTVGPFLDKADGVTIEGALTITNERITLAADTDAGSAPTLILDNITGATSGTANDLNYITGTDAGLMQLELAAADVNRLGRMFLTITDAANHVPVFHEFMVLPAMIYDAFILGTDTLHADVQQWLGTAAATPTVAGVPEVDVTHWIGTAAATPTVAGVPEVDMTHLVGVAQSATDLKDFADDGYDPSTNKVQGVVLTDTVTTYTGNTPQTGDVFPLASTEIADIKAKTDNLPSDPADASVVAGLIAAVEAKVDIVDTVVDAILVDTAEIGAAGAGLTVLATQASVNTIDDFLDTEVAAIKAKTDSLTFTVANQVDANTLAIANGAITAAAIATNAIDDDALAADAVTAIQSGLATAAALTVVDDFLDTEVAAIKVVTDNLARSAKTIVQVTVDAGSSITSVITSALDPAAAVADQFKGRILIFAKDTTTTNLRGQATDITASTSGGVLTVTALTDAPASGDLAVIV